MSAPPTVSGLPSPLPAPRGTDASDHPADDVAAIAAPRAPLRDRHLTEWAARDLLHALRGEAPAATPSAALPRAAERLAAARALLAIALAPQPGATGPSHARDLVERALAEVEAAERHLFEATSPAALPRPVR